MNFAHWTLSEQWSGSIGLRFTPVGATVLLGLFAALAVVAYRTKAKPSIPALVGTCLGLVLVSAGADGVSFLSGWILTGLGVLVLGCRDSAEDGPALSTPRWLPGRISDVAVFFCVVLLQALFRSVEWETMATTAAGSPAQAVSPSLAAGILALTVLAGTGACVFPVTRRSALQSSLSAWLRAVGPVMAVALAVRVSFLTAACPAEARGITSVSCLLAALCAVPSILWPLSTTALASLTAAGGLLLSSLAIWFAPDFSRPSDALFHGWPIAWGVLAVACTAAGFARFFKSDKEYARERAVGTPKTPWRGRLWDADARFWAGFWRVPAQLARSGGSAFVYWQGGTSQYTLLVIVIGTLILFWAALKTQVIW